MHDVDMSNLCDRYTKFWDYIFFPRRELFAVLLDHEAPHPRSSSAHLATAWRWILENLSIMEADIIAAIILHLKPHLC